MSTNNTYIQQNPGLKCPRCEFNIQMDIAASLSCAPIICPLCALNLAINHGASEEGLTALYYLKNGLDKAE